MCYLIHPALKFIYFIRNVCDRYFAFVYCVEIFLVFFFSRTILRKSLLTRWKMPWKSETNKENTKAVFFAWLCWKRVLMLRHAFELQVFWNWDKVNFSTENFKSLYPHKLERQFQPQWKSNQGAKSYCLILSKNEVIVFSQILILAKTIKCEFLEVFNSVLACFQTDILAKCIQ